MKEKYIDIVFFVLLVIVMIAIDVFAGYEYNTKTMDKLDINIKDSNKAGFVTVEDIASMVNSDSVQELWLEYGECDLDLIEKCIYTNNYVENVDVYTSLDGTLAIDIEQKNVLLRIITQQGDNLYIDSSYEPLEYSKNYVADVPVFSCSNEQLKKIINNEKKVEKNYDYLHNLLNFVTFIEKDSFWSDMFVQINLSPSDEIELVPRVGSHIVTLCDLDNLSDMETYTKKLKNFYTKILSEKGWNFYSSIDVKYDKIVVAKKF